MGVLHFLTSRLANSISVRIRKILNWVSERYGNPPLYVTENGVDVPNESSLPLAEALNDTFRVSYYDNYINEVAKAIGDGVKVKGTGVTDKSRLR